MFLAQRPQHLSCLSLNLDLSWQGITSPARPASRTSASVIPLQRQRYKVCSPSRPGTVGTSQSYVNDSDKRYQYTTKNPQCQAAIPGSKSRELRMRGDQAMARWNSVILDGLFQIPDHLADQVEPCLPEVFGRHIDSDLV